MTAQIVHFTFQQQYSIRTALIKDEPWFCLVDVCAVLEIKNPSDLVSKQLDAKGVEKIYLLTQGGEQATNFINEPNLYRVIFRSNKPEAKAFQEWVFNEVLPAIRKTGRYVAPEAPRPGIPDAQWREVLDLIHAISAHCHFEGRANSALHERLRWLGGVPNSRMLAPEQFEDAKAELIALAELADQHFNQYIARDEAFIESVLRPPVSIRKVRALVRRQALQPSLNV